MTNIRVLALSISVILTNGFVGIVPAQEHEVIEGGRYLYQKYCASCHGSRGKGDGSMAASLKVQPADLTRLSEKNAGTFPFWRTYRVIDGRKDVPIHGTREMPVWGNWFRIPADEIETETAWADQVRGRLWQLLSYLESIQEKDVK